MKIILACVGRMKTGPERELLARYIDRARAMARGVGLTGVELRDIDEARGRSADERRRQEGNALLAELTAGSVIVALDERGVARSSQAFANDVAQARDAGQPAFSIVIGGADGLDAAVRARAVLVIAYGAATFPHQLVRVLAAEQIYRAVTILAGHPYHRA